MKWTFGNKAKTKTTFHEFFRGCKDLCQDVRESRTRSSVIPENIEAGRKRIASDRHMT